MRLDCRSRDAGICSGGGPCQPAQGHVYMLHLRPCKDAGIARIYPTRYSQSVRKLREGAACLALPGLQQGQATMAADGVLCGLANPQNGLERRDHPRGSVKFQMGLVRTAVCA